MKKTETIEILGFKAKVARTFWERTRGLIGMKSLVSDEGRDASHTNLL